MITSPAPLWLVRLSVTPSKSEISRCAIGCHIFYETRQIGLFFPIVYFHMSPQTVCPRRCIITQVAFVWLFSTVHFQMCPQMARIRRCIITQVAFVWLSLVFNGNYFSEILHGIIMLKVLFHRQQVERFCPLLLLVLNWKKNQLWNCWEKEKESDIVCWN